jgi:hypothetical protein
METRRHGGAFRAVSRVAAVAIAFLVLITAVPVRAQSAAVPSRWDVSGMGGLFLGRPAETSDDRQYDRWYNAGTLAITAGRYLTRHVKIEAEGVVAAEGERYVTRLVQVPGAAGPFHVSSEEFVRINSLSSAVVWQFFENQWVHPFVSAGASLDFDRERRHTWPQSFFRGDPRIPGNEVPIAIENTRDLGTTRRARANVGAGVKVYVTPRAFFRTDTRIAFGSRSGHVALRLGAGVDF